MTTIYVLAVSANSHGPMALATQHKVKHEIKALDAMKGETRTPEFIKKNPFHCCPAIEEGDFVMWESNACLRYLANCNKIESAYPSDLQKRAKVDQMLDWRQCSFYPALGKYCYPVLGFAKGEVTEEIKKAYFEQLAQLEEHYLKDPTKFMGGFDEPTLADYAVVPTLKFADVHSDDKNSDAIAAYRKLFSEKCPAYDEVSKPLDGYLQYLASQKK